MADEAGETSDSLRLACVRRLAAWLASIERDHAVRVAVDGPDAAGNTTLARELAACLTDVHCRPAICVSLDGFHFDKRRRYRRGRLSPEGYIDDAFDYAALRRVVLDPLGPGGP
jgi:uridine kinase